MYVLCVFGDQNAIILQGHNLNDWLCLRTVLNYFANNPFQGHSRIEEEKQSLGKQRRGWRIYQTLNIKVFKLIARWQPMRLRADDVLLTKRVFLAGCVNFS